MPELPKILTRREAKDSRLFKVEAVELQFSNGEQREYEYLLAGEHAAVIIVAITDSDEAVLVQEYGIGLEAYEWGLPKGKVDLGESAEEAANRELKEEAGFGAEKLTLLKSISQSPNYMQHKTQIVLAQGLYEARLTGDEPETMETMLCPLAELGEWVLREDLTEARTIAALYLARDWLYQQPES